MVWIIVAIISSVIIAYNFLFWGTEWYNLQYIKKVEQKEAKARKLLVDLSELYRDWFRKLELNGGADQVIKDLAYRKILERIRKDVS